MTGGILVLDLETKKSFAEFGGENHIHELGVSVAGVYSYTKDTLFAYAEHELAELEKLLENTEHLIGFNLKHFDLHVLEPYLEKIVFAKYAITDMFEDAVNFLGHRVGLGGLAKATLGVGKSGHGLEALQWFKEGRIDDIKKYCLDDVKITRDLYEHGKKYGHVLFESFVDGKIHSIPVNWGGALQKPVLQIIEEAFNNRKQLAIEYVSSENSDGLGFKKGRLVDIYKIKNGEIEAFCHLRQALRNFRISRILKAELTGHSYIIPQDFQKSLF
jgi:DEAD/DEAH box helicase domain-containing protein